MTNIENYLNDGANYQAQMVLCYLRANECRFKDACRLKGEDFYFTQNHIIVGRFENGREQGYIFGVDARGGGMWQLDDKWMVVENRNSDHIRVRHFKAYTMNTPTIEITFNDASLVEEKFFPCEEIIKVGDYILDGMENAINEFIESKVFQNIKETHEEKFGKSNN